MAEEQKPDPIDPKQKQEDEQQQQQQQNKQESPPESPPSKLPRVSSDESSDAAAVTTAVASPFALGLGLGLAPEEAADAKAAGFTFMQMQEFHHQALIFKHMVAGIPVPIHLILPIWKSVAASYGPHHYPSFVGLGNLCYDFRNSMEPEPGRCRRTDGKKWRCSRDVVPEQKYCERHMHRGRNRSRKPVEGGAAAAAAAAGGGAAASVSPPTATATASTTSNLSDDGRTNNNNNSSSSSNVNINSSDVSTAAAAAAAAAGGRRGSSPISVLSSSTACKTGAS